jgi:hypothetical protein
MLCRRDGLLWRRGVSGRRRCACESGGASGPAPGCCVSAGLVRGRRVRQREARESLSAATQGAMHGQACDVMVHRCMAWVSRPSVAAVALGVAWRRRSSSSRRRRDARFTTQRRSQTAPTPRDAPSPTTARGCRPHASHAPVLPPRPRPAPAIRTPHSPTQPRRNVGRCTPDA